MCQCKKLEREVRRADGKLGGWTCVCGGRYLDAEHFDKDTRPVLSASVADLASRRKKAKSESRKRAS